MASQQSGSSASDSTDRPQSHTADNKVFSHAKEYKDGEPEKKHAPEDSHEALTAGTLAQEKGNASFKEGLESAKEHQKEEFSEKTADHKGQSGSQGPSGRDATSSSTSDASRGASTTAASGNKSGSTAQAGSNKATGSEQTDSKATGSESTDSKAGGADAGATDPDLLETGNEEGERDNSGGRNAFSHANDFGDGPPPGVAEDKGAAEGSVEALSAGTVAQDHGNAGFMASLQNAKEKQEESGTTAI